MQNISKIVFNSTSTIEIPSYEYHPKKKKRCNWLLTRIILVSLIIFTATCNNTNPTQPSSPVPCTFTSTPTLDTPNGGIWGYTNSGFWFKVAADGGSISAPSGAASMAMSIAWTWQDGGTTRTKTEKRYVYDNIPIQDGRFSWGDGEWKVSGIFCSAKSAAGTIIYRNINMLGVLVIDTTYDTLTWEKEPQ